MKVIKIVSAALICFSAFIGLSANAQTPVACTWVATSSDGPPNGAWRVISQECKDASGNTIGGRSFRVTGNVYSNCTHGAAVGYTVSGDCTPPSYPVFYLAASSSSSAQSSAPSCNSGAYIGAGCANSMTASPGFGVAVGQVCGTGCQVRFENLGATNGCYRESPYLKAYCL